MPLSNLPNESLSLVIRFSASIPDLNLSISSPPDTTTSTLSVLIRPHLPSDLAACPLRYIYAGALLQTNTPLTIPLRLDRNASQKFIIHCSISTATKLSTDELELESKAAKSLAITSSRSVDPYVQDHPFLSPQTNEPQGFDRLLAAGFTSTEVASLRSQFLAIASHSHTPDTMPSGSDLRQMEEQWLDTNNPSGPGVGNDDGDGTLGGGSGGLDDLLWGNIMGFFWAVGAIVWLVREEGVWSKRRQIGVCTGVLINLVFCILKAGS